jgi:SAM-dependent methyltransferase
MGQLFKWLRLIVTRRIAINVDSNSLVLDAGCGEKPHWRADVLVDKFLDDSNAKQRNTGGSVVPVVPLFEAPLENLPFADKVFDFAYCSHVLEHVPDPAASLRELTRVAKRGYIEVPFVGIQKIFDQETHLWFCDLAEPNSLIFTAKTRVDYDEDITRFLNNGPLRAISFVLNFYADAATIRLYWSEETPIVVQTVGQPNLALANPKGGSAALNNARHNPWALIRKILLLLYSRKLRRDPIWFNSIVKPEYRRDKDERLLPKVYAVKTSSARNPM